MVNKDYSKITGKKIRITAVYPKRLGDFTDADAHKEGFDNLKNSGTTGIIELTYGILIV